MAIKTRIVDGSGKVTQEGTPITDGVLESIVYKDENGIKFESGKIGFTNTGIEPHNWKGIYGVVGNDDNWVIRGSQTGYNGGYLEIATGDDGTEPIYVSQYGISGAVNCQDTNLGNANRRTATLLDGAGNTNFPGILTEKGARVYSPNNKPTTSDIGAQPVLISGTNIKTINGQSLLGSGNINISGSGSSTNYTWVTANIGTWQNGLWLNGRVYNLFSHTSILFNNEYGNFIKEMRFILFGEMGRTIIVDDYRGVVVNRSFNDEIAFIIAYQTSELGDVIEFRDSSYILMYSTSVNELNRITFTFDNNSVIRRAVAQWRIPNYGI